MNPLLPRTNRLSRSTRLTRRLVGLSVVFVLSGTSVSAWAQDDSGTPGIDNIVNSPEAKNDRSGAPSGNNLVALKTNAATDVVTHQRRVDPVLRHIGRTDRRALARMQIRQAHGESHAG